MKQPRIISVGGCLAALLVTGCAAPSLNSANSLGGVTPQAAIPSITAETPLVCGVGLHIKPHVPTIKVRPATLSL